MNGFPILSIMLLVPAVAAVACLALLEPAENRVDALGSTLFGLVYVPETLAFLVEFARVFGQHQRQGS